MSEAGKPSMEEQLAEYRRRRREEAEWEGQKLRLWNTILSVMTFGRRATDRPSSPSGSAEEKSEISGEETDDLHSIKDDSSKGLRRRVGLLKDSSSGISTDYSDVEPQSNAPLSFCSGYTTLDWVALGLKCLMWLIMFKVFIIIEFGAVYFIISAFIFIWYNMRSEPKKKGEISAYSVFNPDCKPIDGTFTAEQFERELLHKM